MSDDSENSLLVGTRQNSLHGTPMSAVYLAYIYIYIYSETIHKKETIARLHVHWAVYNILQNMSGGQCEGCAFGLQFVNMLDSQQCGGCKISPNPSSSRPSSSLLCPGLLHRLHVIMQPRRLPDGPRLHVPYAFACVVVQPNRIDRV